MTKKYNLNNRKNYAIKVLLAPLTAIAEKYAKATTNGCAPEPLQALRNYCSHAYHQYPSELKLKTTYNKSKTNTFITKDLIEHLEWNLFSYQSVKIINDATKNKSNANNSNYCLGSLEQKTLVNDLKSNQLAMILLYLSQYTSYDFVKIIIDREKSNLQRQMLDYVYTTKTINSDYTKEDFQKDYFLFSALAKIMQSCKTFKNNNKLKRTIKSLSQQKQRFLTIDDYTFELKIPRYSKAKKDETNEQFQKRKELEPRRKKQYIKIKHKPIALVKNFPSIFLTNDIHYLFTLNQGKLAINTDAIAKITLHCQQNKDKYDIFSQRYCIDKAIATTITADKYIIAVDKAIANQPFQARLTNELKRISSKFKNSKEGNSYFLTLALDDKNKNKVVKFKISEEKDTEYSNHNLDFFLLLSLYQGNSQSIIYNLFKRYHTELCPNMLIDLTNRDESNKLKNQCLDFIKQHSGKLDNLINQIFKFEKQYMKKVVKAEQSIKNKGETLTSKLETNAKYVAFKQENLQDSNIISEANFSFLKAMRNSALHFSIPYIEDFDKQLEGFTFKAKKEDDITQMQHMLKQSYYPTVRF